jgi:hypothetical protein
MRSVLTSLGVAAVLMASGCGTAGGSEPSEAEMKEAMLYAMNHPPGITVSEPVTIKFFKKEACDKPNEQGYRCTFEVQVASANIGASMYNNIPFAVFYVDKDRGGKWNMRPPF